MTYVSCTCCWWFSSLLIYLFLAGGHWASQLGLPETGCHKALTFSGEHEQAYQLATFPGVGFLGIGLLYAEFQKILTSSFKLFTPAPAPSSDACISGLHFLATIPNFSLFTLGHSGGRNVHVP